MNTLLLLRHAKSSWDSPAGRDFDRPLAPRGERDAPRMGVALLASNVSIDLIVSSTAARARQTAQLVAEAAGYRGKFEYTETIYAASLAALYSVLRGLPEKAATVMLVGHNPGFEELLGSLCGPEGSPARVRVPTAALACLEVDAATWARTEAGDGTLLWMLVPRIL